jgi:superfamily II DNA or RNA helicase
LSQTFTPAAAASADGGEGFPRREHPSDSGSPGSPQAALELRPYQAACVDALRASYAVGNRAPLFQLATGAGKTVVFGAITRSAAAKGRRVLIAVHRRELVKQACAKLQWAGVRHGIIAAGFRPDASAAVQVGSAQTLVRRLGSLPDFDLIVLDEAHHAVAASWDALLKAQPGAKLLGVTATPARLDGKGLGVGFGGPFDDLVCGPSIGELIADKWLSPARCFIPARGLDLSGVRTRLGDFAVADLVEAIDRKGITGDAVADYRQRADHQPAIAFCATVAHAEHVATAFRNAGYRSDCVHGGLSTKDRDALIAGLGNGATEVLTSCDLISEGLDVQRSGR